MCLACHHPLTLSASVRTGKRAGTQKKKKDKMKMKMKITCTELFLLYCICDTGVSIDNMVLHKSIAKRHLHNSMACIHVRIDFKLLKFRMMRELA